MSPPSVACGDSFHKGEAKGRFAVHYSLFIINFSLNNGVEGMFKNKKTKLIVRIVAIVLCVMIVLSVFSILIASLNF